MSKSFGRKQLFIKNAAILTATSLLLRAVGMYFRIYVTTLIGAEGIGLYQMILSVYVLASGFAASGIVVAVTRMVAERLAVGSVSGAHLVMRRCVAVSLAMGILSAVLCCVLAEPLGTGWLSDQRAVLSLRVMAAALPFMSISCCVRGYFTARRRVGVSSVSQIAEQLSRIVIAVILLKHYLPMGIEYSCMAIMLADVISEGIGCLYVVCGYFLDRVRLSKKQDVPVSSDGISKELWQIAAPITTSHYLTTLLRTVESVLVPDCLTRSVASRSVALELFGMVKGMALPLLLFPATLLTAFSSLIIPEISAARAVGHNGAVNEAVSKGLRITMMLALPMSGVFLLYPRELGVIIYKQPQLEQTIRVLAPLTVLMYLESVITGILRGLGEQNASLRYGIADSVVRLVLIATLVPKLGLAGFLMVMVVSNLLTPLLNIRRLQKVTALRFEWVEWLVKPFAATAGGCLFAYMLGELPALSGLSLVLRVTFGVVSLVTVYAALLYSLGGMPSLESIGFAQKRRTPTGERSAG